MTPGRYVPTLDSWPSGSRTRARREDLPGLALIVVIVVLQAGAELWVGRNYAIALIAVTPLALLMVDLVSPVNRRVAG